MKNNKFCIDSLPETFGVYLFKNDNVVLYVGKAKNIKNRIKQYLNGSINSFKTPLLIEKANKLEHIVCLNEREALLLEQELIKKYKPDFNILLLDDKKYPYIVIKLRNKKLEIGSKFYYKNESNSFYYGPLPPKYGYRTIINFLIRECLFKDGLPIKSNDEIFWKQKFEYAKEILSSSNKKIINKIKTKMEEASRNEQYEIAKDYRDVIQYLSNKMESQSILFDNNQEFDVIAFKQIDNLLLITIHYFKNGCFFMQENYVIEIKISLHEAIYSFLNEFYFKRNKPKLIVSNIFIDTHELFFDVKTLLPKKGKYHNAVKSALANIDSNKEMLVLQFNSKLSILSEVKSFFKNTFNKNIRDFMMIDNSHEKNHDIVSVIIYYKNLKPFYNNYRKYGIKEDKLKNKQGDVQFLNFGLTKYFKNNEEVPDLIVVDGGRQHINEVKKVLSDLKIKKPIIGLVKNDNHQTSYLLDQDFNRINISKNKDIYNFFSNVQQEVDSFAKRFHTKVKTITSLEGFLLTIEGIGPKTEQKLLNEFKIYANIFNATYEDLTKIVSKNVAKKIIEKLGK